MRDDKTFSLTWLSKGPDETFRIGRIIGETLREGTVVALVGELGSGKTSLTQGIARGLNVDDRYPITSPTFTLINEYPGRLRLIHLDAYRLSGSADLPDLGFDEYIFGTGVIVIEWADKIQDVLPEGSLMITMNYLDQTQRTIEISGGRSYMMRIETALKDGGI